jgi:hypothetical protein
MRLKDLYSFKIVRATQQKDRREELDMLRRASSLLFSRGEELVRATWLAKGMYFGVTGGTCSFLDPCGFLVEENKEKILSKLERYKKALLKAKDLIERVPFEEEVDEFTKIVNEHKAEIKRSLEKGLEKLEKAIIACSAIDLSSKQTCRETSRKCHELLERVGKEIDPTAVRIYNLITYLETGVIP